VTSYCSVLSAACGDLSRPRRRSLASSSTSRLLSLAEARDRAQSASETVFDVGGGPSALPARYHTVVDLPRSAVDIIVCGGISVSVCLSLCTRLSNDRWKRLCLVSWAAAPFVWMLRELTRKLTFLLTYDCSWETEKLLITNWCNLVFLLCVRWTREVVKFWWNMTLTLKKIPSKVFSCRWIRKLSITLNVLVRFYCSSHGNASLLTCESVWGLDHICQIGGGSMPACDPIVHSSVFSVCIA